MIHLIIGGARSGKSKYAEKQATLICSNPSPEKNIIYIATATIEDNEMAQRIKHHQQHRPKDWQVIEEPFNLSQILQKHVTSQQTIIIECMTLWLTNWLCHKDIKQWQAEKQAFIEILKNSHANIFIVSNEVGSGIIPMGQLNRDFVDQSGWLNQSLSKIADQVTLVVAGCPLELKDN